MPIRQEVSLPADTQRIFEALTNADQFGDLTDAPAEIDPSPGGKFACFGGMISGRTVESIPGERLVQAWRVATWEAGVYSIVRFELERIGDNESRLTLYHEGYPDGEESHLEPGWHAKYWEPLRMYLAT